MSTDYPAPKGLIELVERKYNLKVIDSHYFLVDTKFQTYHMMINVQFNEAMNTAFEKLYKNQEEADGVSWDICSKTNSIRFCSDIGNNILLIWDKIQNEADKLNEKNSKEDIFSPEYYVKLNQHDAKLHKIYDANENE